VVSFFNQGGSGQGYPGTAEIHPLALTSQNQSDLVAFMQALTGPGAAPQYQQSP
jgi:hypothetical protein